MANYALYYPTIEFKNSEWLSNASLLYDRIYRIVPDGYKPNDSPIVRALCESDEIGIHLSPKSYTSEVAKEFLNKISIGRWNAAGLEYHPGQAGQSLLHKDKCDIALRNMLIGQREDHSDFLPVDKEFAATYMTFLAKKMAENNNLSIVTDSIHPFTASNYFQYDGQAEFWPHNHVEAELGAIIVKDFLPRNISKISPDDILIFRERFIEERQNFMNAINKAASDISQCSDDKIISDMIKDFKDDIDRKTSDLRDALTSITINEFFGWKAISLPIATSLLPAIELFITSNASMSGFLMPVGVALGASLGLVNMQDKKKDARIKSDYSYLMRIQDELAENNTMNDLAHSFHEFIED